MEKPVTVRITEFRKRLSDAAAESQLPPFMLEMLLGEFLAGVSSVARREYESDMAEWERGRGQDG